MDFLTHLQTFMNREEAIKLYESLNNEEIHCLRLNTLKIDSLSVFCDSKEGIYKHPHINDAYIYDKSIHNFGKSIFFEGGAYYIQEPAAMMAEYLLNIKSGDYVLDMCAAPGGKSFDALVTMKDTGLLVCNDIHEIRSKILSSNIEKYGFKNCIVLNDDSIRYKIHFKEFFDKIILDAPCSGSAMFRKNEQAREEWSIEKVLKCKAIQLSLIEDAYYMLKENGRILYSTCSFSIQENEEVIKEFISNHPDIEIININLNKQYNDTIGLTGGLRLYPFKFNGEGQTIFVLQKNSSEGNGRVKEIKSCRTPKELDQFLNKIKFKYKKENIIFFKNKYYLAEFNKIDLPGIKINRYGLELGEVVKGRFEPSHALAMHYGLDKSNYIELNEEESKLYLQGLTVSKEGSGGYKIAAHKNIPLGWVKHVNNTLKNHYPKGLRTKL